MNFYQKRFFLPKKLFFNKRRLRNHLFFNTGFKKFIQNHAHKISTNFNFFHHFATLFSRSAISIFENKNYSNSSGEIHRKSFDSASRQSCLNLERTLETFYFFYRRENLSQSLPQKRSFFRTSLEANWLNNWRYEFTHYRHVQKAQSVLTNRRIIF